MPRYFFHIYNGSAHPDAEGTELPGLGEARREAVRTAGEIIREDGIQSWKNSDWHMEVADVAGQPVLWLRFSVEGTSVHPLDFP